MFDFLVDIIPRDELKEAGLGVTKGPYQRWKALCHTTAAGGDDDAFVPSESRATP